MTDFLTSYGPVVALACAGAAIVYGLVITQRLLSRSPGNERMQEISGAVQEGARAYLTRQYTIIAVVAVVSAMTRHSEPPASLPRHQQIRKAMNAPTEAPSEAVNTPE